MIKHLLLLLFIGLEASILAQTDFNHYKHLQSTGAVPADFSTPTKKKIENTESDDLNGLSKKEREEFVEQVNYTIDELLKSGMVTFGDPVSLYIQEIGDRLTENEPDLKGKLRFYTFNSNDANAFSTDQGMVFVTTGLIAQMTNEAQLAFVLAHEIVHYQEKHVLDLYDYAESNSKFSYGEKVRFFSKYSRDNEFEADKKGVKLFHAAGYSFEEIKKTFDILIYSYLPFEEYVFDKTYYNNQWMFVPEQQFEYSKVEISAQEKYNDRFDSHPNVAKRKEELEKEINNYSDWGKTLSFSDSKFDEIRKICRFEYILNDVYESNIMSGLYAIYLMEKEVPNSRFLRQCKSQLWLELMKEEKKVARLNYDYTFMPTERTSYNSNFEGQISIFARAITRLPKIAKITLGLRTIKDNYSADTSDVFSKKLWDKAIELAATSDNFNLKQFSKNTFQQAITLLEEARKVADSVATSESKKAPKWDKYQIIENQKSGLTIDQGIDSTKFYLYGISDLVTDSVFQKRFEFHLAAAKDKDQEEEDVFNMTDEEQAEYYTEQYESLLHVGLDTVLLINPVVYETKGYNSVDYPKSEALEKKFIETIQSVALNEDVLVKTLDRTAQQTMTAQDYNDLSQLMRSIDKRISVRGKDVFLFDQEQLDSLNIKYGSSKLMLLEMNHSYYSGINIGTGLLFTILFPIGLVYFPAAILAGHQTEFRAYVLDLKTGELVVKESYFANEPASKKFLELRLNALFHQLKQVSDEN